MLFKETYHVVIGTYAKHLSEVAKGNWSVRFEPEVSIVVSWCQVTALTDKITQNKRLHSHKISKQNLKKH